MCNPSIVVGRPKAKSGSNLVGCRLTGWGTCPGGGGSGGFGETGWACGWNPASERQLIAQTELSQFGQLEFTREPHRHILRLVGWAWEHMGPSPPPMSSVHPYYLPVRVTDRRSEPGGLPAIHKLFHGWGRYGCHCCECPSPLRHAIYPRTRSRRRFSGGWQSGKGLQIYYN